MSVRRFFPSVLVRRETVIKLCLLLLLGSVFGALCAKFVIQSEALSLASLSSSSIVRFSFLRSLLHCAVFPSLMSAALVVRSRGLISLLFFAKGFLFSYLLCVFAIGGVEVGRFFYTKLLMESVLPLPALLYVGTVWSEDTRRGSSHLLLLLLSICICFLSVAVESVLF